MIDFITFNFLRFSATCSGGNFFGFPKWYKYLDGQGAGTECVPKLTGLNDIWLIGLAVVEMLLRVAAIATIIYIVYAGIRFMTARGNPDKLTSARLAIQDALIGLVITIVAIAIVSYFAGRL